MRTLRSAALLTQAVNFAFEAEKMGDNASLFGQGRLAVLGSNEKEER